MLIGNQSLQETPGPVLADGVNVLRSGNIRGPEI